MKQFAWCLIAGCLMCVTGCLPSAEKPASAPPLSSPEPVARESESPASPAGGTRKYTGISFNIPKEWRELPDQQFVDSKYIVPTEKGELELTLTSMGGGIDANIGRWMGQIQNGPGDEPTQGSIEIDGVSGMLIDCRGKYNSNVATNNSGTKDDWRLVGIGLPVPRRDFFIRLVGPREAVAEFYDPFMKFVRSGDIEK